MILTVLSGRQETEWFDIEVADEYSVEHLKLMLGVRIFGEPPVEGMQYIMEAKFPEGLWFRVGDNQLLTGSGLREGCTVRIQRAFSTTQDEAPVYGRRSLFQSEKNG
ncbi:MULTISPECIES: hypothetical protein [Paenibacillus]|uniref:Uncharacterized protein n=2 Tax=Paenibacillus TaxID=44249 RepID=A0ABX2Z9G5_PAEPO|nr:MULTISPECIES: hypothetical protein [Paenibacillus]APB76325.1 hypothetical protein PPYC2_15775 [Paenibacillus polymyxa]MBP1175930.1 hypothetical protein [Paenibacillus sp. PvR133]MDR6779091.1 hypothetical protein [Paenibacillus peoriae]ODA07923.1 hypothetical protein A7312_07760 [Paenibacillus polymyxa]OME75021.1 hypothetical protein BK119_00105 [Paenibacillus peoriae]